MSNKANRAAKHAARQDSVITRAFNMKVRHNGGETRSATPVRQTTLPVTLCRSTTPPSEATRKNGYPLTDRNGITWECRNTPNGYVYAVKGNHSRTTATKQTMKVRVNNA